MIATAILLVWLLGIAVTVHALATAPSGREIDGQGFVLDE